jgi:D-alanyl-D-alanine dipeptidase
MIRILTLAVCSALLSAAPPPKPKPAPAAVLPFLGDYGPTENPITAFEKDGRLWLRLQNDYPLTPAGAAQFSFPADSLFRDTMARFVPGALEWNGFTLPRHADPLSDGATTFRITPLKPIEQLQAEALAAQPPEESGLLAPDLVELVRLDRSVKLDIRYASKDNFLSTPVYTQARAFLQRPAAEALVRAHRWLKQFGYGLLIHDGYRPWYVTKMFWDATPEPQRIFVADPSQGSRHNRGCAVDVTLYDLRTGKAVEMPSLYDEMSIRAYPDYPGGTALARWLRDLLRQAMEREGFTVYEIEWWHFDYKDWKRYPISNLRFEDLGRR